MRVFLAALALCAGTLPAFAAPRTITAFAAPSPGQPVSGLVAGTDGASYGVEAGALGLGSPGAPFPSVFRLAASKGRLQAALIPVAAIGGLTGPVGTLVAGAGGVLYGSATLNGCINLGSGFTFPCAAVVSLTPPAAGATNWTPSLVYSVMAGGVEITSLASGPGGTLIGATSGNVVFQLTPPASGQSAFTYQTLYTFTGGADGGFPTGRLLLQSDGSIIGTTFTGGAALCGINGQTSCGTVFRLNPPAAGASGWSETTLYSGTAGPIQLSYALAGSLYGVDQAGQFGDGAVIRLDPGTATGGAWTVTNLASFNGDIGGGETPTYTGLVPGPLGRIYGTTAAGGLTCVPSAPLGCGTIFELKPTATGFKKIGFKKVVLWAFTGGTDGAYPYGGLLSSAKYGLLGETYFGGAGKLGTLYRQPVPAN